VKYALAIAAFMLAVSPVLFAQASQQTQPSKTAKSAKPAKPAQTFAAHDLNGMWMRENAPVNCSIVGEDKCEMCDTTHTCVTGTPGVAPGGFNILPTGVNMTPWAHDRWMSQDGGKGISGNADPYDRCDPPGIPNIVYGYIHPFMIVQAPDRTWMIFEEAHSWRMIYTDGRPMPKAEDLPFGPTYMGFSIGHWDGNTFVVDTTGMNDKTWLDNRGHPHSEDLKLKDTYRRVDHDHMEVSFTMDDPKAYDHIWTFGPRTFDLKTGTQWEMQESFCIADEEQHFNSQVTDPTAQGVQPPRANAK
jgi:hypothetical protein